MNILGKALYALTAKRPMRLICIKGQPYLERYFIARIGGTDVWLHHFLTGDGDRAVHNHPWSATFVILTGGYLEATGGREVSRLAPCVNVVPAAKRHRIVSVIPGTWTLGFISGRHGNGWHFFHPNGTQERGPSGGSEWHLTAGNREQVYDLL